MSEWRGEGAHSGRPARERAKDGGCTVKYPFPLSSSISRIPRRTPANFPWHAAVCSATASASARPRLSMSSGTWSSFLSVSPRTVLPWVEGGRGLCFVDLHGRGRPLGARAGSRNLTWFGCYAINISMDDLRSRLSTLESRPRQRGVKLQRSLGLEESERTDIISFSSGAAVQLICQ